MDKFEFMHIDMDAFFAAVEEKDNPALKGYPLIVGGKSRHGIVTTCNYEARKYGIHSAMPIFMARKRCPKGIFIQARMWRYKEISDEIMEILYSITDMIEQLSIDEAFLDISEVDMNPLDLGLYIKGRVKEETGLTVSVGISYNKFLAKLATDWNKPDGIKIITRDMIPGILLPLSVKKVYGIGAKSSKKLNDIGICTVEDLMRLSEDFLIGMFGKAGSEIYDRIRGIDNRKIEISRERKSIGSETTFEDYITDKAILKSYLLEFSKEISEILLNKSLQGRTITIKTKDEEFVQHTRSKTLIGHISSSEDIHKAACTLLDDIKLDRRLRLIGLTVSNLTSLDIEQLSFLD
ncbi:DNA polymerase IV [Tissierella creatinini]|nr:DNA polymerase IV [Tissierella creatinini]TJX62921.1 DNA polymerase IV [Soehngenia saccharolytica]